MVLMTLKPKPEPSTSNFTPGAPCRSITATRSVDIVGDYQPLPSGFNYLKLGVKPQPVSAYQ